MVLKLINITYNYFQGPAGPKGLEGPKGGVGNDGSTGVKGIRGDPVSQFFIAVFFC